MSTCAPSTKCMHYAVSLQLEMQFLKVVFDWSAGDRLPHGPLRHERSNFQCHRAAATARDKHTSNCYVESDAGDFLLRLPRHLNASFGCVSSCGVISAEAPRYLDCIQCTPEIACRRDDCICFCGLSCDRKSYLIFSVTGTPTARRCAHFIGVSFRQVVVNVGKS